MYIKKIIKFYFISSLVVAAAYIGPHVGNKEDFMANVLGMGPGNSTQESEQSISRLEITLADSGNTKYAKPGQTKYNVMDIKIKNTGDDSVFNDIEFKILGVDPLAMNKAVLMKDDTEIAKAHRKNDMLIFNSLGLELPRDGEINLSLFVDFNASLIPGTRLQFQTSSIKSPYITIVNERPKFRVIYK